MLRLLAVLCAVLLVCAAGVKHVHAADIPDNGPPYTDAQFLALAPYRLPNGFARQLNDWWKRAPDYLRQRILSSHSDKWWFIIECDYMGFKPEGMGAGGADKCVNDAYRASQRGKSMWSADGQWIGPSEECKKRDKRTQFGELICD
jgi:hypothetical protein